MVWVPAAKLAVLKEAVVTPPDVLTLTGLPALLPSIWNCTVPVGVPVPGVVTPMVAVKVTFWLVTDGLAEDTTAVLVLALLMVCVTVVELLAAKLVSPLYEAVMVWFATV